MIDITAVVNDGGLVSLLTQAETVVIPEAMGDGIEEIFEESIKRLRQYPPETAGNQPPPPYYQRKKGMIGWGGDVIPGKESEDMTAKWEYTINRDEFGTDGTLRNMASYSGLVHGLEGVQAAFHGSHGWRVASEVVEEVANPGKSVADIANKIRNTVKRFFGK